MKTVGKNISLNAYDDIFSTEESRQAAQKQNDMDKLEKVQMISLKELHPFHEHPFKVKDDAEMENTVDSVKQFGVLVPAIARPMESGGYELIAGHRRHHASELAGLTEMPVIVLSLIHI